MDLDRRSFLQLLGLGALAGTVPESIARALSIPAHSRTGTLADVEHVVILMQENRAFDHYLGTLSGVRGFGDPRAVRLQGGNSVFRQPVVAGSTEPCVLPYHPTAADLGLQFIKDLAHDWTSTHQAWNAGHWDQWVTAKSPLSMVYLTRADIPYHYALADAFTVCDAYHASLLGPTDPNRYHLFTGWVGNDGAGGGPEVTNAEAGYGWLTFPEVLQDAGIRWRVYQDIGTGLDAAGHYGNGSNAFIGNYGDNALLYFHQYREAPASSPLHQRARSGTNVARGGTLFDELRADCAANTLPQVSWVVAPEAYSEHPNWPANYGAYYISQILDALTANPAVWSRTALFVMYDENDGFFDHVVPPTPAHSPAGGKSTVPVTGELFPGASSATADIAPGPYGLGPRVPMFVISPWSKGGWVSSETFDHTSLIRFVQARFGTKDAPLELPNLTPWRRAVCGDLTSAFNFATPNDGRTSLPATAQYRPPDQDRRRESYAPPPPATQSLPVQERGVRPARSVPYVPNVAAARGRTGSSLTLTFSNSGTQAAVFQVRLSHPAQAPKSYTVGAHATLTDTWALLPEGEACNDVWVHGPNGFYRHFRGSAPGPAGTRLESRVEYDVARQGVTLVLRNAGAGAVTVAVQDLYAGTRETRDIGAGTAHAAFYPLAARAGWYDFVITATPDAMFRQQLAGHLEDGKPSTTDPALG